MHSQGFPIRTYRTQQTIDSTTALEPIAAKQMNTCRLACSNKTTVVFRPNLGLPMILRRLLRWSECCISWSDAERCSIMMTIVSGNIPLPLHAAEQRQTIFFSNMCYMCTHAVVARQAVTIDKPYQSGMYCCVRDVSRYTRLHLGVFLIG